MIWKSCTLYAQKDSGDKDALGNAIYTQEPVLSTKARHTPWTDSQIALEGREITSNEQRYALPIYPRNFPKCDYAEIDGIKREITEVIKLEPRYTVIQVRSYKE